MGSRRQAREHSLQALYQCDTLSDFSPGCVDLYFKAFHSGSDDSDNSNEHTFAKILISGVIENLEAIDSFIAACSQNWSINRMSRVDRNILRIGTFEICFLPDIPPSVTINEAIEVAKKYAADDSPMFINGVLDKIATEVKEHGEIPARVVKKVINA